MAADKRLTHLRQRLTLLSGLHGGHRNISRNQRGLGPKMALRHCEIPMGGDD